MGFLSNLLFGDNSNKTSYKDAATQKAYEQIASKTWDSKYGGLKDYLDKNYGSAAQYKWDTMDALKKNTEDAVANYNAGKNNFFGNGLIGGLLNPVAQTLSSGVGLLGMGVTGGKYNPWDKNKDYLGTSRDWLSDIGALGETALTALPMAKGASLAGKGASIGSKMAKAGLMGAGYGATGSLREMGSENFDPGQLALSTAIGGGVGAGIAGLGGLWNKYTAPTGKGIVPAGSVGANTGEYQNALNTLKEAGIDTTNPELAQKSFRKWSITNHPDKGGSEELFKKVSGANDLYQKLYETAGKGGATPIYSAAPKQSFGQKLSNLKENVANTKTGNKVANLLKTKKGKVLAGAGAGLLLAQLLRSKGQNNNLSDEEMQEIYNYIYGGGQ